MGDVLADAAAGRFVEGGGPEMGDVLTDASVGEMGEVLEMWLGGYREVKGYLMDLMIDC